MATASTPTFRSLSQMIGDMVASFLSELDRKGIVPGLQSLKPGSPYLAIFEATGQSQFRNQEQTLSLLDSNDLDLAHGERLDRIGAAEKLPRRPATFGSGYVDISDTSFVKVASRIYQGKAAPIPGASVIYVADATSFSAVGSLYIGRGTPNLEGPLAYSAKVDAGGYWTITLTAPTTNFHGLGETVTLAQGGNRLVTAGQGVSTPAGNQNTAAEFVTTSSVTLLDGETVVTGVPVSAKSPGAAGNAPTGSIKVVATPAFTGMAVTNPLPITNGQDVENDDLYRERLKSARRAKAGVGTPLGLSVYSYGVQAPDEAATVTSAQYVSRTILPALLVVDDGTGYEAKDSGIPYEVLTSSAIGGEHIFYLAHGRPVAKPSVVTLQAAPYALVDQANLTVKVGGVTYTHSFATSSFSDITNASAYEVVASINSNASVPFSARTVSGGKYVAIFAQADVNDDIEVIASAGVDANDAMLFPAGRVDAVRLYKNDLLLSKDGLPATLVTANQSAWGSVTSGDTLVVSVDGTPAISYSFTDADAIALGLGYTSISSSLPLSTWAALFNAKVAGVTATVSGGSLVFTSNLGSSARAAITIEPASTMVIKGVFSASNLTATGRARDYVLDRNLGQVDLVQPLTAGDSLTIGTAFTRAYLQGSAGTASVVVPGTGINLWFVVDGGALRVLHSLNASNRVYQSSQASGKIFTAYLGASPAYPFTKVQAGDYAVWAKNPFLTSDSAFGVMRVSEVDPLGQWFRCDLPGTGTSGNNDVSVPVYQNLFFVRSDAYPQQVSATAGTAISAFQSQLVGATTVAYGTRLRVMTNTYASTGNIALVAQDQGAASLLGLSLGNAIWNDEPETAAVQSGNSQFGTPNYATSYAITSYSAPRTVGSALATVAGAKSGLIEGGRWLRAASVAGLFGQRIGTLAGTKAEWTGISGGNVVLDSLVTAPRVGIDLLAADSRYRVGPVSSLNIVADDDPVSKGYTVPMTRWLKVDATVPYGQTIRLKDADNLDGGGNPQSLAVAFGQTFDFSNYVLHAHARARFNLAPDVLLLRLKSWSGRESGRVAYLAAPLAPSSALQVLNRKPYGDVEVVLASGAARPVSIPIGATILGDQHAGAGTDVALVSAFVAASIVRTANVTVVTLAAPAGITSAGLVVGQQVYVQVTDPSFSSGLKTVSGGGGLVFTYADVGLDATASVAGAWAARTASPVDFTGVQVGDYLSLPADNVGYWSVQALDLASRARARVLAVDSSSPARWVTLTSPVTFTAGWVTVASASDITIFPLAGNTVSAVVASINALTTSSVTATLAGGTGAGAITDVDDLSWNPTPLVDGLLHIASASYNANPLIQNYDLTLKLAPDTSLVSATNDWAHEEFRLAPTTAKNVVDYLSRGQVTGLVSAGIQAVLATDGDKVQLSTSTAGSAGSIQVSGGTANALRFTVLSATLYSPIAIMASVTTSSNLDAVSNRASVMLDNALPLPKVLDWTGSTTLTNVAGTVTAGGAGHAWTYPVDPSFGTKWLWDTVGGFMTVYPTFNSPTLAANGGWVHFEAGVGQWSSKGARVNALVGSVYITLNSGRVLAIGGCTSANHSVSFTASTACEVYDPTTDTWSNVAVLPFASAFGAACTMPDGRIFYCGGRTGLASWTNHCAIYDPNSNLWIGPGTVADMAGARSHHAVNTMPDGRLYVTGGFNAGSALATTEFYTPFSNSFIGGVGMQAPRAGHAVVPFGTDQLLVVGGIGCGAVSYERFSLSGNVWSTPSAFVIDGGATRVGHTVVQLSPTTILVAGGALGSGNMNANDWAAPAATAEVYNISTHTSVAVGSMHIGRSAAAGALMSDGRALVIGGIASLPTTTGPGAGLVQRSAEVYDLNTMTWSYGSASISPHVYGHVIVNSGGKLVVAGSADVAAVATSAVDGYDYNALAAPAGNLGTFRVLNSSTERLMVEAPGATAGSYDYAYVAFYTYDSVLPGDLLRISSSALGNAPQGSYTVTGVDLYDRTKFSVEGAADFATGALGLSLSLVSVLAAQPSRMLYQVRSIFPDDANPNQSIVGLVPPVNSEHFSAVAGSVLTVLDKLDFPTSKVAGQDGYRYNTGLIAQVTKVVYGDERDTVTYPGVASAGAYIDVSAPLIRRVKVSLAIRARAGAVDVKARVQAAVVKVINSAPPGPIAISLIIDAVQRVDGVLAVVMLDPVATTTADSIPVQPYEKALVLDQTNDVQVSFIGV